MIFKIVAPNNAVSIVLAEDIRRIEFPTTPPGGFTPMTAVTVRMADGSTVQSTFGQSQSIEDVMDAMHPTAACMVPPSPAPAK